MAVSMVARALHFDNLVKKTMDDGALMEESRITVITNTDFKLLLEGRYF